MPPPKPYPTLTRDQRLLFWEKVDVRGRDECWPWTRALKGRGFGALRVNKQSLSSHRVVYEMTHGAVPQDRYVYHVCGVANCCNPRHLICGTKQEVEAAKKTIKKVDVDWRSKKMPSIEERFWSRVDKGEIGVGGFNCWLWTGDKDQHGYGRISRGDGKKMKAHRLSWEIDRGIKAGKMFIRHTCDNPSCVNPAHLLRGNHKDNMNDMKKRGRSMTGTKNPLSKLSREQVEEMRELYAMGEYRHVDLAEKYGISRTAVTLILNKKRWS